jgi:hypothetical protein
VEGERSGAGVMAGRGEVCPLIWDRQVCPWNALTSKGAPRSEVSAWKS